MPRNSEYAVEIAREALGLDPTSYINHYKCVDCGHYWSDKWTCTCDDECAKCGTIMTPYDSDPLYSDEDEDNG